MAKRTTAKSATGKSGRSSAKAVKAAANKKTGARLASTTSGKKPNAATAKSAGVKTSKASSGKSVKAGAGSPRSASGTNRIAAGKNAVPAEKLRSVTPSGYKDQTFFEQVFDVARQIPKGRVTSYGAIAASLGAKSSSRMVGWAMNLAGGAKPKVPAHRVVNRNGMLSGKHHFATPTHMQELLEREGIRVKDDKVVDFNKLFWDPMDLGD